jgi:uncharacterized protein (TIGR00375 family)
MNTKANVSLSGKSFIADFHIHSRFSLATSQSINIPVLNEFAQRKGIALLGTGDFTHPIWIKELQKSLKPSGNGLFAYNNTNFILTAEVCNIFYPAKSARKIHSLIFSPSFESAEKINKKLGKYGSLKSDGRPILNMPARDMAEIVFDIDTDCYIVPSHIWTPHFGLFGSKSGFDDINECFDNMAKHIFALETGLSSDPKMNWQLSKLDKFSLLSNSDAHSPVKLGREANIFNTKIDYFEIRNALKNKDKSKFIATIEFFPEEGKYHWDGHQECKINLHPDDAIKLNNICPVCKKELTIGVMHRVKELSDRPYGFTPKNSIPYYSLVPLIEILAQTLHKRPESDKIKSEYLDITSKIGTELQILLSFTEEELFKKLTKNLANAILNVRNKKVKVIPGYDGVYGKVNIL